MITPTDDQVEAAWKAYLSNHGEPMEEMRAALTAAFSLAPAGVVEANHADRHLGNLLQMLCDLAPDEQSRAFTSALAYYNGQHPEAKVEPTPGYSSKIVHTGPLDALLPPQPSAETVTEYQAAYALLWRMRTTDKAIHEARRSLLNAIGKDGQRAGLDWALATFGPHKAPTLEELP